MGAEESASWLVRDKRINRIGTRFYQCGFSTRQARIILVLGGLAIFALAILVLGHLRERRLAAETEDSSADDGGFSIAIAPNPDASSDFEQNLFHQPQPYVPTWRDPAQLGAAELVTDVPAALVDAERALAEGRLYQPPSNNALRRYRDILHVDPQNARALEGVQLIAVALTARIAELIDGHRLDDAAALFPLLKLIRAEEPEVLALADRLEALQVAANLVTEAWADLQADRLIAPKGNNALARLWHARTLDPDSVAVAEALAEVEVRLIERGLEAGRNMAFDHADNWLEWAHRVREGSPAVTEARRQLTQFRSDQIIQEEYLARVAMSDARFKQARGHIASAQALGASAKSVQALLQDLELSRIYGNFSPGQTFRDAFVTSDGHGPQLVVLPQGSFRMGADAREQDARGFEYPAHEVHFQRGVALAITETTVAEFRAFVEHTGYETDAEKAGVSFIYSETVGRITRQRRIDWRDGFNGHPAAADAPVVHVSWRDASAYAAWLAEQSRQPYRLPTEAEFEYGQRAGSSTRYWWGDDEPTEVVENLTGSGDQSSRRRRRWNRAFPDYRDGAWGPAPVASYLANELGLYDMAGNVAEWVVDCWHDSYVRAPADGSAWVNPGCERRVVRGGFWGGAPETARSAYRTSYVSEQRGSSIGFRVARDLVVNPPQLVSEG